MFHHVFVIGLSDIGNSINGFGAYSIEFDERDQFCFMSVRFWKGDFLCRVTINRVARTVPYPTGFFGTMSRLMSAISAQSRLVSISGGPAEVFQTFDKCVYFKKGVQYPFRFDEFNLARLMHRQNFSVFGRVDFFSVLEHLISALRGALYQSWTLDTLELTKVGFRVSFRLLGSSFIYLLAYL